MPLDTNFDVAPFYDDYNANNNYHRILFRPAVAVQARELTQLQTILQNQIERFGDNIFTDGTIIQGCNFIYDPNYNYIKLPDNRQDGQPINVGQYTNLIAYDSTSNLQAIVVNGTSGYTSQNPNLNTLYVKYLNSGVYSNGLTTSAFSNGTVLTFYANSVYSNGVVNTSNYQTSLDLSVAPSQINGVNCNPVGTGYSFSVTEGVIFQKGVFIRVANNISTIVSAYDNQPNNVSVGFTTEENIVTELIDPSLLDNASGYTNANAPGAWRLQLIPKLTVAITVASSNSSSNSSSNTLPSNNFLTLVQWQNGNPIKTNQTTSYNLIGNEMARRESETSGNFVVNPFTIAGEVNPTTNTSYFTAVVGAGLGYVNGFRVQQLNPSRYSVRKGNDVQTLSNQAINSSYGNYVKIQEFAGYFGIGSTVNLYDTATSAITNATYTSISPSGNVIGTAVVLSLKYNSGTVDTNTAQYNLYLTNIQMNSGKSFSSVKGVAGSGNTGIADIVLTLTYNANGTSSNTAVIQFPNISTTVFPTGKSFVKTVVANSASFSWRTTTSVTFSNTSGVSTNINTSSGNYISDGEIEVGTGNLTAIQEEDVIVIPQSTAYVTNATGNVTIYANSTSNNIFTGNGTAFTTSYQINDYIAVSNGSANSFYRITNIANNTYLTITPGWAYANTSSSGINHFKVYPKNVPINLADRNSYINVINTNSMAIHLMSASNTAETFQSINFSANVYYSILTQPAVATSKNYITNNYVCIDTAQYVSFPGTITTSNTTANVICSVNTQVVSSFILPGYSLYLPGTTANNGYIGTVSSVTSNGTSANIILTTSAGLSVTSNAVTYSSINSVGPNGPWPLGFPDVHRLIKVYKIGAGNSFTTNSVYDVTSQFILMPNQTDTFYNISLLAQNPNNPPTITNGDRLTVVYNMFTVTANNSGPGYFTVDSYPIDDSSSASNNTIKTQYIPVYVDSTGNSIDLRNAVDFRAYVSNTVATANALSYASSNSTINPIGNNTFSTNGYPNPTTSFNFGVQYYQGRNDKIILNSDGVFTVVEGLPSDNPNPPADQPGAMTIATVNVVPYPSLLSTQITKSIQGYPSVTFSTSQNSRYTMADIGKLEKRINNLEYYSSLSLLEQQTASLTIVNSATGQNRYKNGIFVDNLQNSSGANVNDSEYNIGRDYVEDSIIPVLSQFKIDLQYVSNSSVNSEKTGDLATISYSEFPLITQTAATRSRNCTTGLYNWSGVMATAPTYETFVDVRIQPVQQVTNVTNINNYNTTNINNYNTTEVTQVDNQPAVVPAPTVPTPTVFAPVLVPGNPDWNSYADPPAGVYAYLSDTTDWTVVDPTDLVGYSELYSGQPS